VVTPTDPTVISAPIIAQRHENNARTELRRIEREELAGINHEVFVRFGHPAPEIIAAIRDITPDLVVMATHGRVGVSHFLLGSVTEKVVRESPVPVLTIRQRGLSKQSVAA
jgi:nucleotide-binding universal stress UspA family protein